MIHKDLLIAFGIDILVTLIFTGLFYYRRHKRHDLFVTFTFFNIAMFIIVTLISRVPIGIGAGFGLFALLGIVRLRNEEFSNYEIGYFFGCLTLAIINGLVKDNYSLVFILNAAILVSMGLLDHPWVMNTTLHSKVNMDAVYTDDAKLEHALEKLLNAKILNYSVTRIDTVRDTTNVSVNYKMLTKPNELRRTTKRG